MPKLKNWRGLSLHAVLAGDAEPAKREIFSELLRRPEHPRDPKRSIIFDDHHLIHDWDRKGGNTHELYNLQTDFAEKRLAVVAHHPQTGQKRISLSATQLSSCRRLSFLVLGADKAERVSEIFSHPAESLPYPAARIRAAHGQTEWYLDMASARNLPETASVLK